MWGSVVRFPTLNLDFRVAVWYCGFDGLVLFEFSQGVSWEFGVVSVLWSRFRGLAETPKCIVVPA